ncbi:Exportin-2 [Aphelenchoides besseyi]|nr:Exportin-2 [Aphelenchoides besseyi]KAI6202244.1 Exportin-2 [Aphelenchoides besseyi]
MLSEDFLVNVLRQTISVNSAEIRQSEEAVKSCSKEAGYGVALLQVAVKEDMDAGVRLAAAIALKNFIRCNWDPENELAVASLGDAERQQIRHAVLVSMFTVANPIRPQLLESVCLIGARDFPNDWPELITFLAQYLNPEDLDHTYVSIACIEQLTRRYRHAHQSTELIKEIIHVIQSSAEALTKLYQRLVSVVLDDAERAGMSKGNEDRVFEILLMNTKCYLSFISQDLPEFFEDHLKEWMDCFFALLKIKADSHSHDNEPTHLDDIKRVECEIFALYAQRYEEPFNPFMMPAIEGVWQLLMEVDHRMRFDSLVGVALGFLSAVSERSIYSHIFQADGVLEAICQNVIIKNLTLRREDLEQFQDEPFDYFKRDIEGADLETRRRGATDFVRALTKHFEVKVFSLLSTSIQSHLTAYAQNPAGEWLRKDVVYFLVSALASKATTERHGATSTTQLLNITDYYSTHVRNDLFNIDFNSYPPILIADALNFVVLFRNHFQPEIILEIFGGAEPPALGVLNSSQLILHHYVGYAFDKMYMTKRGEIPIFNSQNISVHDYINGFCRALQQDGANKSSYLMKGLSRAFSLMDPETAKTADNYIVYLVEMIHKVVQESQDQTFVDLIFECLSIFLRKTFPYVQSTIHSHLIPLIDMIIEKNVGDLLSQSLQLVGLLVDQAAGERKLGRTVVGGEVYEKYFPLSLNNELWARQENARGLMAVLEAFVRTTPESVLTSQNINAIMGLYQRLISNRMYEVQGFQLATVLLPHYGIDNTLTATNILIQMLQRLQTGKTPRFQSLFTNYFVQFAREKGTKNLSDQLETIQGGLFNTLTQFLSPEQRAAL